MKKQSIIKTSKEHLEKGIHFIHSKLPSKEEVSATAKKSAKTMKETSKKAAIVIKKKTKKSAAFIKKQTKIGYASLKKGTKKTAKVLNKEAQMLKEKAKKQKKQITEVYQEKKAKKQKKLSNTQILHVLNDDELKTKMKLPIITEEMQKTKMNKLHEYDIYKTPSNILIKIKIFLLNICKAVLILSKKLENLVKSQYNSIRRGNVSKQKKKNKKQKTIEKKMPDNEELVLLRYRDYKGFAKITIFFINRIRVMKFDMKKFNKKFKYGTMKDKILIILMMGLICVFSLVIAFCIFIIATAPEISEKRLYKNNATILIDVNGDEYARIGSENREKVYYEELPEVLIDAIVATEDSRFFQHNGIDIARFTKAALGQLMGRSDAGGGSTLTMQVSKNAATSTTASGIEGLIRKFTDIYLSVFVFEKRYTKEQIMEFYVNIPNLGAHAYGVEQASQTYFGKSVSELNLTEAATIAGLFQAPSAYNPYAYPEKAENRRNTVLNLMCRHGYITESERDAAKEVPVTSLLVGQNSSKNEYQDFVDTVIQEIINRTKSAANPNGIDPANESMIIYTTMDPAKQKVVNQIMTGEKFTFKTEKSQAGISVIKVEDGSIAAIGASRDPNERVYNFATSARRHPGSTAKPVIDYGPAIEYLNWSTGQTIIDDKMTYSSKASIKNWDNRFLGIMTIKKALAQSRNIPALFAFQQTTNEQKAEFVKNLGWTVEDDGNGKILESCSIGGFKGVTPVEASAAYATFARGGTYIEPYSVTKYTFTDTEETVEVTPKKVTAMSEETAYMINMILKYAVTSGQIGAGSVSGTDIAAKTGTSTVDSNAKKAFGIKANVIGDSWEIAYSPDYAIATWYGYAEQLSKDYYLTSKEGGNARKAITKFLVKGIMKKNSRFHKPSGIVTAEIELETDPLELASPATPKELRSTEYFKKGTAPTSVSNRFQTLENPTNLKYSSTANSVTVSWTPIATPNAINQEWLKNYFNSSKIYKRWADKYLQKRISYNNSKFGALGYHVYVTNASGTRDLGFTTNTTFTANLIIDAATKITVKSSYQNFKSNQSSGASIVIQANSSTPNAPTQPTTTETTTYAIEYIGPSCSTVDAFNALGSNASDKIKVTANGQNVTSSATISYACYNTNDEEINCSNLESGKEYDILFTIRYNNSTRNKRISLKSTC